MRLNLQVYNDFKVRIEAETEKQEYKQQLLLIKERGQTLIESLKQRNEQSEFEIRRMKEENAELANQISSLKKDAKNSLSVQEDLVRLIQSLQIELNSKSSGDSGAGGASGDGSGSNKSVIEVRCQHEDDFNDCAACKAQFGVTRRKHRCKHCCKIFCADCCNKTVYSGPNMRPHKVCDMCHTLLDKDLPSNTSSWFFVIFSTIYKLYCYFMIIMRCRFIYLLSNFFFSFISLYVLWNLFVSVHSTLYLYI